MTPTVKSASDADRRQDADRQAGAAGQSGPYVLNLCSSTTPMALARAEQEELRRFSFFVSRRFEEGRERFRLHMGFFATLAEAEEWLSAVRDIYPGAWAGEAPGKKLRERAVAAAAAQAQHAAGPPPRVEHAVPTSTASIPPNVPTVSAAPPLAAAPPGAGLNVPTLRAAPPVRSVAVPTIRTASTSNTHRPSPINSAAAPGAGGATKSKAASRVSIPAAAMVRQDTASHRPAPHSPALQGQHGPAPHETPHHGAALPGTAQVPATRSAPAPGRQMPPLKGGHPPTTPTQAMLRAQSPATSQAPTPTTVRTVVPTPAGLKTAAASVIQRPVKVPSHSSNKARLPDSNVKEVLAALDETTGETRMMPAPALPAAMPAEEPSLTDTQVLRFLETRRADGTQPGTAEPESGSISLLKPDDTGTRRALKDAVNANAPVFFAVQLQWSVQPVELAKVPPLAIFSAYTLYTVEGSRDGRKWYGLRLGFFSDAISAKQVAYYVRSEFTSVAVVPVSPQERQSASDADKKAGSGLAFPRKTRSGTVEEFKLIDPDMQAAPAPAPPKAAVPPLRAPQPRTSARKGSQVRARERRGPQTLEETLEILGASQLEIDGGSGETLNESGVRHLRVQVQKNTPFTRLLERLSERVRKG